MIRFRLLLLTLAFLGPCHAGSGAGPAGEVWGFFAHRRINRLATFTLPIEMMPYFRGHIDYLAEHAVDPDKRRYATIGEAERHYIDLDHWGAYPFTDVPRRKADALMRYGTLLDIRPDDTVAWRVDTILRQDDILLLRSDDNTVDLRLSDYRKLWLRDPGGVSTDSLRAIGLLLTGEGKLVDNFSEYGILPYHLMDYHRQLTRAFVDGKADRVLQLAAEMGHYIGDAHVPLHTTENYNGQLTGQEGIHAFWESRLPELFADEEYDYFVGAAEYISDPAEYFWNVVMESHRLVDSVLTTERRLRDRYPASRQMCFDQRMGREVLTQCPEYARAWSEAMNGMVESRFRAAVRSVGSVWYSCWVDAGQPDLQVLTGVKIPSVRDTLSATAIASPRRPHE